MVKKSFLMVIISKNFEIKNLLTRKDYAVKNVTRLRGLISNPAEQPCKRSKVVFLCLVQELAK